MAQKTIMKFIDVGSLSSKEIAKLSIILFVYKILYFRQKTPNMGKNDINVSGDAFKFGFFSKIFQPNFKDGFHSPF